MCLKDNGKMWLQLAELDGAGRRRGLGSRLGRVGQGVAWGREGEGEGPAKGGFGGRTCMSIHENNSMKPLFGCLPMQKTGLEAKAALGLVVGDHDAHGQDGELRDGVDVLGENVGLDGGAVLALGLLGREHEGLDEEGDDLADVDLGVHGVVALLPVEVALGLAEGVEADGAGHVAVPHELEERLGVGVFHVGLAQLRLLVRRVRPSRDDAEDGDGEAGLAHTLQLLGVARDAVVVDALE